MLEVEVDGDTEVIINTNVEVTAGNMNVAIIEDTNDIEVTVNRQEYVITGDEIYIPKRFEDAPTWMQNLINQVVDVSISAQIQDMNRISQSLKSMIDAMEVAKNTYELSVISSNDIDERINTVVTTLNSSMNEADATVLEVAQTRVTPEEASAITVDVITAELAKTEAGTLGATVSNLQTAVANEEEARSTSIEILTSSIEGAFDANATAMNYLNTYVGVTEIGEKSGTGLLADVEILQKQNDGVIETTTGTYDVMINPENPNLAQLVTTSEPYATWRALDATGISSRLAHIGDVYVKYSDTTNGAKEYIASYKFIRTIVDETSPYATDTDGFTWALIVDQAAQDAYEQALNAFDLADNKRRVFVTTPSGPYDIGDLWTKAVTGGSMLYKSTATRASGYNAGDWVVADDAGLNVFVSDVYTPGVTSLQNQVDGKIESWYTASTSDPKSAWTDAQTRAKHDGDMWYQTDTKLSYYYSSSTNSWNLIDDAKAILALSNAATAQATADGKITSYYMATFSAVQAMSAAWTASEKASSIGDLAVVYNDTTVDNNGTWRWDGASWVTTRDKKLVALASQVTALSTDLKSGDGTWADADSTLTNSLTTKINDKTAAVESKFAYNSIIGINGIYKKSGFGLTTNYVSGSGTEVDPYVSEFWIDASRFKFTNSNVTGSKAPFTIDATGTVPEITFNGKVSFNNVTDYTPPDISGTINNNNNVFAQRLGYMSYADMVTAATNGKTIINGGYLRTSLIKANSIVANQINTIGLVADGINANTIISNDIVGNTITGSIITGARINGAIIKASYLDLDGDLEVLTNYHISVALYNSNPALFIDAVFIASDNEYRIPSISIVKEPSTNFSTGTTYGTLRSYNTANVGHNMKAVKRRPTFQNLSGIHIATGDVVLKLGNITLGTFSGSGSNPTSNTYFHDFKFTSPYTTGYNNRLSGWTSDVVYLYNVPVFGDLRVERNVANIGDGEIFWAGWINVYLAGGSHTLPFDWDNPSHVISIETPNGGSTARISGIQINNMI